MKIEVTDFENEQDAPFIAELIARNTALYVREEVEVTIRGGDGRWMVVRQS